MAIKCVTAPKRIVSRIITQGGMGQRRELISSGFKAALPREKKKVLTLDLRIGPGLQRGTNQRSDSIC